MDVAFEESLRTELKSFGAKGPITTRPTVYRESGLPERADGNNVDIDREVGELKRNTLMYQTYLQILTTQFAQVQSAIRE